MQVRSPMFYQPGPMVMAFALVALHRYSSDFIFLFSDIQMLRHQGHQTPLIIIPSLVSGYYDYKKKPATRLDLTSLILMLFQF